MSKTMIISSSNCVADNGNCYYKTPHSCSFGDIAELKKAVSTDYTCCIFRDNRRSIANFVYSDCVGMDLDNDHSDNPEDWKKPEDVQKAFPGVEFAVHYSRNNMKVKDGKSARPRFHVLFPVEEIFNAEEYTALKRAIHKQFPYFDENALDAARFFFGTPNPEVEFYGGKE